MENDQKMQNGIVDLLEVLVRNQESLLKVVLEGQEEGSMNHSRLQIGLEMLRDQREAMIALLSEEKAFP